MDPQQPEETPDRAITIRLTRETLLLVAFVGFLLIAILLALLFQPNSNQSAATGRTAVATGATTRTSGPARSTPVAAVPTGLPTQGALPFPTTGVQPPANAYPEPTSGVPGGSSPNGAYPLPGRSEPTAAGRLPVPAGGQPTAAVPTFQPSRPTAQPGGSGNSAYPPPPGANTQPTIGSFSTPTGQGALPTEDPLFAPDSTATPRPTQRPVQQQPTQTPQPQQPLPNITAGADVPTSTPRPPAPTKAPPPPTAVPVTVLRGNIRWTAAQSPVVLARNHQLVRGATLTIDPGVEVRLAPGVAFYVEGTLYALGQQGNPVRIVGRDRGRWDGLYGRPGSTIILEQTEVRGGGNGGTVLTSEGGALTLRGSRINDNGGHVRVADSRLEMRDSEIAGNDMPYGAALDVSYNNGGIVTLINNRIGGNRMAAGAPPAQLSNLSSGDTVNLDVQRNLLIGQNGPDLVLSANGPLQGNLTCNSLLNGTDGLSLLSNAPQVPGFALNVRDNAIEDHTPPILPIYLKYGIGRGATSAIALDMRNNWWESDTGPYEPDTNADGRGEAVGVNITYSPWLTGRPDCAPRP